MANKTTQTDLYNRIKTVMAEDPEVVAFCEHKIAQIAKARENAKSRPRKANTEVAEFREEVFNFVAEQDEPVVNKVVAAHFGVTTQKSASALNALAHAGRLVKTAGETTKAPATYAVAEDPAEGEDE